MSQIISTADAAIILDVTQRTVVNLLKRGELKGQQLGREWAVDRQSVLDYKAKKQAQQGQKEE